MKTYDSTTEMPMQPTTPLAVQAVGAGITLAAATLILLGFVAGLEWETVSKIAAIVFCIPLLLVGANAMVNVIEPLAERITGRDLNMSGAVGDRAEPDIRLMPFHSAGQTIGVDASLAVADLRFMVSCLDYDNQRGWTVREWMGARLPSGRKIVSANDGPYAEFITILEKMGALVDRTERDKGQLTMSNDGILQALGL